MAATTTSVCQFSTSGSVKGLHVPGLGSGCGGGCVCSLGMSDALLGGSEKETMQNLNGCPASYLDKVRHCQPRGEDLRVVQEAGPLACRDYSHASRPWRTCGARVHTARYKRELHRCMSVEANINGLHRVLDKLTLARANLEMQVENLKEELANLRKNHRTGARRGPPGSKLAWAAAPSLGEMNALRGQTGGDVSVEMGADPGVDLSRILNEMCGQYEKMAEKSHWDAEDWFFSKTEEWNCEVTTDTEPLQNSCAHSVQIPETELKSQLGMEASPENSLAEMEARCGAQLAHLQGLISSIEAQPGELRCDMEKQSGVTAVVPSCQGHTIMEEVQDGFQQATAKPSASLDATDELLAFCVCFLQPLSGGCPGHGKASLEGLPESQVTGLRP
ncbi:keratin, type I cytoskeletal 42-like [Ctenodactylus gundi]